MQKMLSELIIIIAACAMTALFAWMIGEKRNDHDESDRDR